MSNLPVRQHTLALDTRTEEGQCWNFRVYYVDVFVNYEAAGFAISVRGIPTVANARNDVTRHSSLVSAFEVLNLMFMLFLAYIFDSTSTYYD